MADETLTLTLDSGGDVVIIISYVQLDERELDGYEPNVVIVDQDNNIVDPEYIEKRQTEYTHQ